MYCPSCGSEERQATQFCRACGIDLRLVRSTLERPDSITASAVGAREEIGRAFAERIRETQTSRDLKRVAENVLPHIEKFLESPAEKRLRRMRAGVILAAVGLGITLAGVFEGGAFPLGGGLIVFLIGLGILINGLLFTVPGKKILDRSAEAAAQNALDGAQVGSTSELDQSPGIADLSVSSVTEHTTHQLKIER
jgi:Domain of unknown function (DUF6249)